MRGQKALANSLIGSKRDINLKGFPFLQSLFNKRKNPFQMFHESVLDTKGRSSFDDKFFYPPLPLEYGMSSFSNKWFFYYRQQWSGRFRTQRRCWLTRFYVILSFQFFPLFCEVHQCSENNYYFFKATSDCCWISN